MRVVFVCTGNTCRSPMAEAMLKSALRARGREDVAVSSAGLAARYGDAPSENAVAATAEYGLDIRCHIARPLDAEIAREALLLCMTRGQLRAIEQRFPWARVDTIAHFAGGGADVSDPHGGPLAVYRRTAREIAQMIQNIVTEGKL